MRKGSKKVISMYLGVALLAGGSLFAASTDTIRATVPFDFMVGKQAIAAGEYTIRKQGFWMRWCCARRTTACRRPF